MRTLSVRSRRYRLFKASAITVTAAAMSCALALPALAVPGSSARTSATLSSKTNSSKAVASRGTAAKPQTGSLTGPPPTPAQRAQQALLNSEHAASLKAATTRKPVVVSSETNTGTLVTANPNGTFTLTETSEPVRVKQDGTWVPINPDLVREANGTLQAAATATGVSFSGGGTSPMATLTSGSDSLSFTFPGTLPKPTFTGTVATYHDVLPGTDLQLTANASGFSELLVVHSATAAANPALRSLRLGMSGHGVSVASTSDGGAQARSTSGATVFHTDTASMWDSSPARPAIPASTLNAARVASMAGASGSAGLTGGHLAQVGVHVSGTSETLLPDSALLASRSTVYPVYIDPAWSGNPSQLNWARISSNGWNIYNSTSTASSDHPRSGYDAWTGGDDEVARTFYQMDTSGIAYAHVTAASLYVVNNWSADSSATNMNLYSTAQPVSNGWNSTDLNWSNQPSAGTLQDGSETSYETSSGTASPGTIQFNILNGAQASASNAGGKLTLLLESGSETNDLYWKQYASGGGATISVTYYTTPDLVDGTGNPTLTPVVQGADPGFTDSPTPTLKISCEDNSVSQSHIQTVENIYQIWNYSGGTETTEVGGNLSDDKFTTNGDPVTSGTLANGSYAWRAMCKDYGESGGASATLGTGQYWDSNGWSAWQVFTVDTTNPPAPSVGSPQFPAGMEGGASTEQGTFTFNNDHSSNVMGYLFSLDGDLSSTVFGGTSQVTIASNATLSPIKPGTVYYVPANGDPNGYSVVTFAPGSTGPHRVFAKAVDQAGNTSGNETTDLFWAGSTTPTMISGTSMEEGGSILGSTVPAATYDASGGGTGTLGVQSSCCGINWYGGSQAWLTGAVNAGDSATFSFPVPSTGVWDLGLDLTKSYNYGSYSITLNANTTAGTPAVSLVSSTDPYDAYAPLNVTAYRDLGVPQDSNGDPLTLRAGVYSITFTLTGKDASSTGYDLGFDALRLAPMAATCPITSMSGCYNNTAISPASDISSANADGAGDSFAASYLADAGWTSGAPITVNGAPMTLPAYGDNEADNVVAGGQTVTIPATGYANTGNAIEFLAFSTYGPISDASGTVNYADACVGKSTTQGYTLSTVPDWVSGPAAAAATTFPGLDETGTPGVVATPVRVYAISVPLACDTDPVTSITLPAISDGVQPGTASLHILALGIRPPSYTDDTNTQNWTASFGAREDSQHAGLAQTTVRMPAVLSVGGTSLRIHLSNALGPAPVTFNHVTVAEQSAGDQPVASTMTNVTFGGNASVTIPAGGDVTSDPVSLATTQEETLLVSVYTSAAVADPVGHWDAMVPTWTTSSTSDESADTTGSPFAATSDGFTYWLTGIDVTSPGNANGAVAFYGDQTINSDTSNGAPNRFTDDVTADLASSNGGTVPYGVLDLGRDSLTASNNLIPVLSTTAAPTNAADPIDRDIIDQANLHTVLISTGTADILAGESAITIENELKSLANDVEAYYSDTTSNNPPGRITVYVATIPPSSQFTTAEETVRKAVNAAICGTGNAGACDTSGSTGADLDGVANGFVDFAGAVSAGGTDLSSTVAAANLSNGNPDEAYYSAEAAAFITATTSGTLGIQPDITRTSATS